MITFPNATWGVEIISSPHLVERVPYPRSPARAKRRAKLGHPQHMAWRPMKMALQLPDGRLCMHPEMLAALRARLAKRIEVAVAEAVPPPPPPPEANLNAEEFLRRAKAALDALGVRPRSLADRFSDFFRTW